MNTPWPSPAANGNGNGNGEAAAQLRLVTHVMYGLHTLSWLSGGLFAVVAVVINFVKRNEVPDAFYASHFRWQWRSFWFTLLWLVVTAPLWLIFVFPGYAAWFIVGIWYLYRFIRGWWAFVERRPMPVPTDL